MPTIMDIARETGYSLMTVSRAFNNPEKVSPKTLEIVLKKAEEIRYFPNNVARSLARKCTNIIYVYIPRELAVTEPFVMQTVASIGERLGENGYSFLMSRQLPRGVSYDGVIMMGMTSEEENKLADKLIAKPAVLFGNHEKISAWVDVDNFAGETLAVNYLLSKGRRRIACAAAPQFMHYARERLSAYRQCIENSGTFISDNLVAVANEVNERSGYECAKKLLAFDIDAIVCATDSIAIGCINALKEAGASVPDDVAVVGFDGFGYENVVNPKLTTVKQPLYEAGAALAENMIELVKGGKPQRIKLPPTLVINESA